jgi:hypothetical protein
LRNCVEKKTSIVSYQNFEVFKKSIIDGYGRNSQDELNQWFSYTNAFVEQRKAAHNIDPPSLCNNS